MELHPRNQPVVANTPGEALRAVIEHGAISQTALANSLDMGKSHLSRELSNPESPLNRALRKVETMIEEIEAARPGDAYMWAEYWVEKLTGYELTEKQAIKPRPDPGPDYRGDIGITRIGGSPHQ